MAYVFPRWAKNLKMDEFFEKSDYPLPSNITISPFTDESTSPLSAAMIQSLSPTWDEQNVMVTLGQLKAGLTFPLYDPQYPLFTQILSRLEPSCGITQLTGNSIRVLKEWCLRARGLTSYDEYTRIPIDVTLYTLANFFSQYKCTWGERGSARWGLRFVTNTGNKLHFLEDVDFSDGRNAGVRHSSDGDWKLFPLLVKGNYVGPSAPEDFKPWVVNLNEENLRTDADDLREKEAQNQGKAKTTSTRKRKGQASASVSDIVDTIPLLEAPKKKKKPKTTRTTKSSAQASDELQETILADTTQQTEPTNPSATQEEEEKEQEKEVSIPSSQQVHESSFLQLEQSNSQSFDQASGSISATPLQSRLPSSHKSNAESLVSQALTTLASASPDGTSPDMILSPDYQNALSLLVQSPLHQLAILKKSLMGAEARLKEAEASHQKTQMALKEATVNLSSAQEIAAENLRVVREASDADVARLEEEINFLKASRQEAENSRLEAEAKLVEEKNATEQRLQLVKEDYASKLTGDCHAYLLRYLRHNNLPVPNEDSGTTEYTSEGGEEEESTADDQAGKTSTSANPEDKANVSDTTNPTS